MAEAILAILAALAPVVVVVIRWWLDGAPKRKVKNARHEMQKIAKDVRAALDGDAGAFERILERVQRDLDESG